MHPARGSRSTVGLSTQASYTKTPPVVRHVLSGTTLTLSCTCPSEVIRGVSYTATVPRGVALQASTGSGSITLTSLSGPVSR